ncbi:MAG TPA: hypothetical protein VGF99_07480 [Myxococcota bacterium]
MANHDDADASDAGADALVACLLDHKAGGYAPTHVVVPTCSCGTAQRRFTVLIDDEVGVAVRVCAACGDEHGMGDADDFFDEAEPGECECPCGGGVFDVAAALAAYDDGVGLRWVSIGLRCVACDTVACYGDWKNEGVDVADWIDNA